MTALVRAQPLYGRAERECPISGLRWADALGLLEGAAGVRLGCRAVTFVDRQMILRSLMDSNCRAALAGRILLPVDRWAALGLQTLFRNWFVSACPPERFIPSLLTFMGTRRRIGLVGPDVVRLESTRDFLKRHAPWHEVSVIELNSQLDRAGRTVSDELLEQADCDVLVVDASGWDAERQMDTYLAFRHDGLMLHAGKLFDACVRA